MDNPASSVSVVHGTRLNLQAGKITRLVL